MQKKTKILLPLFFILTLITSMVIVNNVFAQDEYGNYLFGEDIYQNNIMTDTFNSDAYYEGMDISISNYLWKNFMFVTTTMVNTTVIGHGGYVNEYQGVGIQIYDEDNDIIYANGITPMPSRLYNPEPFEYISYMSEVIELSLYKTINHVNVTLWHNYEMTGNVTDYELTESWKFDLVAQNYGVPPPTEEEDMFKDLYLLGFILCIFLCPLSITGAIKLRNVFFIRVAIFTGIGFIIFFFLLMNIKPFGG